ncbi:intron-binding aquarius isoform X2 [Brachionus plicatilis]|uniref:RNA helicase aquarius n=1 Tax=Brachionus plicatilis TaxID=10195 RepID=A0A3M7QXW0_BRAPC|nr:intron-binding aquarius isoform X2 [Brachionus plicatilis]
MQPGLTMVVGPPGTGKTDVAVQIISNIYHNFPNQKTLIVTHSNQALNQIFEKIMHLDIDERHLLRLGHGEEQLETEKDFSRYGRVNYILAKRLELLDEVDRLQKTFDDVVSDSAAYSCETASHFYTNYIQPKWESYMIKIQKLIDQNDSSIVENVENLFPFGNFFSNAPQPLFKKESWQKDLEISKGCFRYLMRMFKQLDEFRAFELIRSGADRAEYLLVKEAKIIAMTCTHAALRRRDLVKMNFRYDNILMEEAAQILEIETFIPLLLQDPDHNGNNRLKRWIMIGDHNQLPPVIKNQTFQKYSNMEQSLFTRFVKLGIPTVDLDAQGRSRSSLCELFSWRYKNLGSLSHVNERDEFRKANTGFKFDYQLINVEDFNGVGESEPQPFFYQNLAEAEYLVAVFMYMRMIGYPGEKITILSTYNGQKHLIRDVLRKRCANNPIIGLPRKITTVDKYQGQQNDYILLSLVKTRNVGHLRDVRRLIVAMSRARLGLYIFCRCQLFRSCYELTPVFNILTQRPTKLCMLPSEFFPTERMLSDEVNGGSMAVNDMPEMTQFVFDFYKSRLEAWKKNKREMEIVQQRLLQEERIRKLDEEEKVLREKLEVAAEKISRTERLRIQEDESSSEESENEDQAEINEVKSAENEEKNQDDRSQEGNTDENVDNRQTEMIAEQAEADEETIEDKTSQAENTNVVNDHSEMVVEQNEPIQAENDDTIS